MLSYIVGIICNYKTKKILPHCFKHTYTSILVWLKPKYTNINFKNFYRYLAQDIGEGNGNPLQCSCLENPRDGRAWWAAVSGVAQSQTRLKRLSSSRSKQRDDSVSKCLYLGRKNYISTFLFQFLLFAQILLRWIWGLFLMPPQIKLHPKWPEETIKQNRR